MTPEELARRVARIRQELAEASDGRYPAPRLIAVTKTHSAEEILPLLAQMGKELAEENDLKVSDLAGFGISAPGPADIPNGILLDPPNNKKWHNVLLLKVK